jgi:putative heme-binding domain-containing protein
MLERPDPAVVAEAMSVAGATKDGAVAVGERVLAGKLPRDLLPRATDALARFRSDPQARELAGKLLIGGLKLGNDAKSAAAVLAQVKEKGDPHRGRDVYLNLTLVSCATCHKLEGVGGSVGPDLTRMWDTQSLPKLLESITDPSKEIKEGYQAYRATMTDGRVLTGLRVAEEPMSVLMRDAEGREIRLPHGDIETLTASGQSLMPSDAVSRLSFDQLLDLLAFLKDKGEQEGLRGTVTDAFVAGGFAPNLLAAEAVEKAGGDWHRLHADATGRLDVRGTVTGPTAGYVRAWAFSPAAQTGTLEVTADGPVRAWVGDKLAVERPGPSDGQAVPVQLGKGWTKVLVKAVTADPKARLVVRVKGTGVRVAAAAE